MNVPYREDAVAQAMVRHPSGVYTAHERYAAIMQHPRFQQMARRIDSGESCFLRGLRNDDGSRADVTGAFALLKELEFTRATSFRQEYPDLKMRMLFPDPMERTPRGAEVTEWSKVDHTGRPNYIGAGGSKQVNKVSVALGENKRKLYTLGLGYDWTFDDLERAAFQPRRNLPAEKQMAVSDGNERGLEKLLAIGDTETEIEGAFTHTGVTANPSLSATAWQSATSEQIVDDLLDFNRLMIQATLGTRRPTRFVLAFTLWNIANNKRMVDGDKTISPLESFRGRTGNQIEIDYHLELDDVGVGGAHRVLGYAPDPMVCWKEIVIDMEDQPVYQTGSLEFEQIQLFRTGGIVVRNFPAYQYLDVPSS